ncbi:hypothetical protein LIER_00081 [Lithospermum erythrorhizon]|uniref:Tetratricopeptide repeat protein 1 n=1 Tax=Lithospermum erythrorhizon TaxID=34254 RepID=A0AAV3NHA8_LITER
MVVIEPVVTPSSEQEEKNKSSISSPTVTSTVDHVNTSSSSTTSGLSDYNSDGYETASETELNDPENGNSNENANEEDAKGSTENHSQAHPDESKLTLVQANDAKLEGNTLFKEGQYDEALLKYELALQVVQDLTSSNELRAICHANRGACFSKLENYKESINECTKALELNPSYTKALIRRGEAHEKLGNYEDSITDMTKILELDPSYDQARRNIIRLKPLADEKKEKMKEEMIGKLKEMGNSILGRFGMSVDNFKAVKDPNTGSYSLSFQQ